MPSRPPRVRPGNPARSFPRKAARPSAACWAASEDCCQALTGRHDANSFVGSGVNDLVDRFRQSGQGPLADSWVNHGPNQPIGPHQMEQAIGPDTLTTLQQQTGLSREELLARLSRELPQAIDHYTPDGQLPPR